MPNVPPRILDLTKDEDNKEWRSIRGIGSADASSIVGVDPWSTPYSTWELKTRRRNYTATNQYMQRGIDLEPEARREFEFEYGGDYPATNMVHGKYPFIRAALDGWNYAEEIPLEIKCPGKKDHELALSGTIPPHYVPRLDHLIMISNAKRAAYCSYEPNMGIVVLWRERDETVIKKLLKLELAFWEYIQKDVPPPLSLKDLKLQTSTEWATAAEEFYHWDAILTEATSKRDTAKQKLIELCGDQSSVGGGVKVVVFKRRGNVAYKKATEDLMDIIGEKVDLEKYRGEDIIVREVSAL